MSVIGSPCTKKVKVYGGTRKYQADNDDRRTANKPVQPPPTNEEPKTARQNVKNCDPKTYWSTATRIPVAMTTKATVIK